MSRRVGVGSSESEISSAAVVLQSFLNEFEEATVLLDPPRNTAREQPLRDGDGLDPDSDWASTGILQRKLRHVSVLCVDSNDTEMDTTILNDGAGTDVSYRTVHALLRLVRASQLSSRMPVGAAAAGLTRVVDLALLSLANLLESPSWRHLFFRALGETRLIQKQEDKLCGKNDDSGRRSTLQDILWQRVIAYDLPRPPPAPLAVRKGNSEVVDSREQSGPRLIWPVDHSTVRLTCHMVRHCPLSFPASSYASLAPQLTDYLLRGEAPVANRSRATTRRAGGNSNATDSSSGTGAGIGNSTEGTGSSEDLVVLLDIFSACVRGSPHFRQHVKDSRSKRELFRRLLGFLSSSSGPPRGHGDGSVDERIVVRALCALTRVLAGEALEGKVRFSDVRAQCFA